MLVIVVLLYTTRTLVIAEIDDCIIAEICELFDVLCEVLMSQVRYRFLGVHIRLDVDTNQFPILRSNLSRADPILSAN